MAGHSRGRDIGDVGEGYLNRILQPRTQMLEPTAADDADLGPGQGGGEATGYIQGLAQQGLPL